MQLKNIMVAFNGTKNAAEALHYGIALAKQNSGFVTAVMAHSNYEVVASRNAWVPRKAQQIIEATNAEILDKIEQRFSAIHADSDLGERLSFQSISGRVDVVLSEVARSFDIMIAAAHLESDEDHVSFHPDRIALMSGRPVIILPKRGQRYENNANPAVIWHGSRSCSRALWDSLPLLDKDSEVTLLTIKGKRLARPIDEVITQLARHNINAKHVKLAKRSKEANSYLDYCKNHDPSLLVMGAYEHSKFREDLLGGLTSEILAKVSAPVLISH